MTSTEAIIAINKRLLLSRGVWTNDVFEVRVLEVSPSGERMKVRHPNGAETWLIVERHKLVEALGD